MYLFTFTYTPQWSFEFCQVIAKNEESARLLIGDKHNQFTLQTCFMLPGNEDERVLFDISYDNPSYEG